MKVLAFSDLHRDVDAVQRIMAESQQADVIIGAGDFATGGLGAEDTLSVLKASNVPVIIVSGNHDNTSVLLELCDD
jgi:predicted phosphodiesterase